MRRRHLHHPDHTSHRSGLRALGAVLVAVGGVFTAIGLLSFFSAFGGGGTPTLFWCAFVGLPMLGVGLSLLKFGYMGSITRYMASEVTPVATDAANYVAGEMKQSLRGVAAAIGSGLRDGESSTACSACGHGNEVDAQFCNQCGAAQRAATTCARCQRQNDPSARFCSGCGDVLAASN